jgi:FlgD Ig-like domain
LLRSIRVLLLLFLAAAPPGVAKAESNLSASSAAASTVTLMWTTPGDDSLTGVATAFDMRYATVPLTTVNFATSGTPVGGLPAPAPPGSMQSVTIGGLAGNTTYFFAIKTVDERGNWSGISNVVARSSNTTEVGDPPVALSFSSAFPNPARQFTHFSISLPEAGLVRVEAFDVTGRHVRTLMSSSQQAGPTELQWNLTDDSGRALDAGIYLVHATLGRTTFNRRVAVIR